jgi:hypothetical protein
MPHSAFLIDLGTIAINCTLEEIETTFYGLLVEMRAALPRLRSDERSVLRQIMANESGSLKVSDVFPNFKRESEGHKTLRRLRAAQFIRPAKTGRWDADEKIEVKPFGWLVWNRSGEASLFSDVNVDDQASECEDSAGNAVIDLASPEVNQIEPIVGIRIQDDEVSDADDLLDVLDLSRTDSDEREFRRRDESFDK